MRAVTLRDGEFARRGAPGPRAGGREVLVRVRAAGLNGADMMQRRGLYPAPPGAPQDIPGSSSPARSRRSVPVRRGSLEGDRVMAIVAGGGQAERAVVHERALMPVPDALDVGRGRRLPGGLHDRARRAVHAGGAEGGRAAPRPRRRWRGRDRGRSSWARATGADVTATVRNEELRPGVEELGARAIAPEGFEEHGEFDVVLELVGAPNLGANLGSLATGGRIVVIGVGGGAKAELNLLALMGKRGRIMASTLRARPLEEKAGAMRGGREARPTAGRVGRGEGAGGGDVPARRG